MKELDDTMKQIITKTMRVEVLMEDIEAWAKDRLNGVQYSTPYGEVRCRPPMMWPKVMGNHRVDFVRHYVKVNPNEPLLAIPGDLFHCVDCKLMGSRQTFDAYKCL